MVALAQAGAAYADAIDRLQPEKLGAVRTAIKTLRSNRRDVKLRSGYDDVRACLHVHSSFSHDSRGTLDEIVEAANQAGVRVIMFTEHPANTYDYFVDGHRGVKDGVLLIPGAETRGFLAYPRQSIQKENPTSPQAFADLVRSTGGLVFVCHLEERMDWQVANVTGTEIYNTHADVKDEARFVAALRAPITLLGIMPVLKHFPQEVFGATQDYPVDYLKRYDELCQQARHTGIAGNDAHHNVVYRAKILEDGNVLVYNILDEKIATLDPTKLPLLRLLTAGKKRGDVILNFDLDPYVCSFRHVSTHLLLKQVDETEVRRSLAEGRAYVAFDWLADPTGFVYQATWAGERRPMGSEVALRPDMSLEAEAPLDARFKLVRDGTVIQDEAGHEMTHAVQTPGVYRIEVWLNVAGDDRPWILSNPIYIRPAK
jgi:hypothetical protein